MLVTQEAASTAAGAPRFIAKAGSACASPYAPNVTSFEMIPFQDITGANAGAKFTVYFFSKSKVYTNTTAGGTPNVVLASTADVLLAGGATILPNLVEADHVEVDEAPEVSAHLDYDVDTGNHYGPGHHSHHGHHVHHGHAAYQHQPRSIASVGSSVLNLRSGAPGQHSSVAMAKPFKGASNRISSISLEYQFVVGYGAKPNSTGASLSLGFISDLDCPESGNTTSLYTSPKYTEPLYKKGGGGYSAPVRVELTGLDLLVADAGALTLDFDNGDHNLQVLLPLNFTIGWK